MEREYIYNIYVTDTLKGFCKLKVRYADLVSNHSSEDESPEDVISNVRSKIKELGQ